MTHKLYILPSMKNILLISLAISGISLAQMDHSGHNMTPSGDMSEMTEMMDMSDMMKLSGKDFDRAFLSMMIPHHEEAVNMAKAVLPKSKNDQVKKWATSIISAQQSEINTMQTWLKTMGGIDSKMQDQMKKDMAGMTSMVKKAADSEREFVVQMLPHHASAVMMANMALEKSSNDKILKLSRDIVVSQAGEMYAFKQWLKR